LVCHEERARIKRERKRQREKAREREGDRDSGMGGENSRNIKKNKKAHQILLTQ